MMFDHLPDPIPSRVVVWFSCGVTSAVAAKLALVEHPEAQVIRIKIGSEHEDADRFARECSVWLGKEIKILSHPVFVDHFEVIRSGRFVKGPHGAKCSGTLKREARQQYQRGGDLHVFGFDADETERVEEFRENNPGLWFSAPLIDAGLTKSDCKSIIDKAGIRLHKMYELGYANANCVGCVKGGAGYWNRIRTDFPATFQKMARIEREIGATCLRHRKGPLKGQRLYLDELDPKSGRFETDQPGDCGPLCQVALEKVGLTTNR